MSTPPPVPSTSDLRTLGFERLVSLLEAARPGCVALGGEGPPQREAVRFTHDPSLGFSASDISRVEPPETTDAPALVQTTFLGLTGASSPLPGCFLDEAVDDESGLRAQFLDLFHHRLLSVLYRGLKLGAPARSVQGDLRDPLSQLLLAAAGLDLDAFRRAGMRDAQTARLIPLALHGGADAPTLARALEIALEPWIEGAEVRVVPFAGGHARLDPAQRPRLGLNTLLAREGMPLGSRVPDPAGRVELHIGPLPARALAHFEPGGPPFSLIQLCVERFADALLDYGVVLHPAHDVRQRCRASATCGSRLGLDARLGASRGQPRVIRDARQHANLTGRAPRHDRTKETPCVSTPEPSSAV